MKYSKTKIAAITSLLLFGFLFAQENKHPKITIYMEFYKSDSLIKQVESKYFSDKVNNGGGNAVINNDKIYRPDWNKVKDVMNEIRPISDLGCD